MKNNLTWAVRADYGDCVSALEQNLAPANQFNSSDSNIVDEGTVLAVVHKESAGIKLMDREVEVADLAKNSLDDQVLFDRVGEVTSCFSSKRDLIIDQIDWNKIKICVISNLSNRSVKSGSKE
jgi:hypothetical protein